MTPDQFFAKFALLSETPNAVAKMRELILDLALSGRLCDGEIASLQHKRIPLEKVASFINGDRGKNYPSAVHRTTDGVPFVNAGHLKNGDICTEDMDYISEERFELLGGGKFQLGDVIYCLRGSLGKCAVVRHLPRGAIASSLLIMRPHDDVLAEFLYYFLVSPSGIRMIKKYDNGSAQPNLSATNVKKFLLPLPPLAEQKRIVAKVDELMALCDQLESQQKQRETKKATLVQAALTRFTDAPSPANLEFLFQKSYAIDPAELRKTILTLAVTGNLTKQDNELDGTALEALSAVQRFRAHSAINRSKVPDAIDLDGVPHDIPDTWEWVRLAQVTMSIDYGTSGKSDALADGIPVYRMGNIAGGKLVSQNMKYVRSTIDDLPKLYLKRGDLLFNRTNSAELVGKCAVFEGSDDEATFASYLIRVRLFHEVVSVSYVNIAMNAPYFRTTQIEPEIVQQCGQANFNGTKLARTMLPLPPLAEQKRIVAKVEELMALVDKLEAQLAASRDAGAKLIEAVVAELARAA